MDSTIKRASAFYCLYCTILTAFIILAFAAGTESLLFTAILIILGTALISVALRKLTRGISDEQKVELMWQFMDSNIWFASACFWQIIGYRSLKGDEGIIAFIGILIIPLILLGIFFHKMKIFSERIFWTFLNSK